MAKGARTYCTNQYVGSLPYLGLGSYWNDVAILNGNETVLIVDDETFMLSLAEAMLARHGYTVLIATSAKEVLHMFEVWPDLKIDVVVLDVVMPGMDGFELAERIRKIRPALPILYMSAYPEKAELRPEETRNVPFVPKPFNSLTLVGKIREVLDKPLSASTAG